MASYGLGQPSIIGCHNTHRVAALKDAGGFAPHDADDILLTLLYREHGWQGVYVPKILARGLTPVDWTGYLTQQLRWARSGLNLALHAPSQLSMTLPLKKRLISVLHGLNYLYKSFIIFTSFLLVAFMLATGIAPKVVSLSTLPSLAVLLVAMQVCEFYRQRFYLDPRREWGLHWRAELLTFAKWPYVLLAFFDVISGRRLPYALTRKVKDKSINNMLFWPHLFIAAFVCIAWLIGLASGHFINPLLHISAAIIVSISIALILTEHLSFPDPYDKKLRNYMKLRNV
jgi:cellulose synthase (UDP-forming)